VVPLGAAKQRALLAMLALHANKQVSADRLIDGLWGEAPPASAPKMVQLYVSRLRKELDGSDAEIVTRGRGYELRVSPDAVDALRFTRAVEAGQAREALALWQGAALDDVAYEPFAAEQIRHLEELWLRARELAIDDALAAGTHVAVLGEIEDLLAEHPFRERIQAQRMLALYRAGRQADALAAYREARRRLIDEVGIEPGPELRDLNDAILRQDPALDLRPVAAFPRAPFVQRRWALIVAVALVAVAVAAVLVARGADSGRHVVVEPNSVAIIDPEDNTVMGDIPVQLGPGPIGAAEGRVWVLSLGSSTLSRIDGVRRKLAETAGVGGQHPPGNLAVVPGNVWVAEGCQDGSPGAIYRLDMTLRPQSIPENGTDQELEAPPGTRQQPDASAGPGCGLAAAGRTIWMATPVPAGIARLDIEPPESPQESVTRQVRLPFVPSAIAVGDGSVWVRDSRRGAVWRMDPRSLKRTHVIETGTDPAAIAIGAGAVWVANAGDGSVSRVDPLSNVSLRAISVGDAPVAVAVGAGAVWVANSGDGTISRIDPRTNRVVATITVGHRPQGVAVGDGAVWVSVRD
jgi:YVTN family beta-propeller protein